MWSHGEGESCGSVLGAAGNAAFSGTFRWWFELWVLEVSSPCNVHSICIHSLQTGSIMGRKTYSDMISDTAALFLWSSRLNSESFDVKRCRIDRRSNKRTFQSSESTICWSQSSWFDYTFIRGGGGGYCSSAELQQTFPKTWLCTCAFVLIIIAALYDESLISSNKSSFQDVEASG